MRNFIVTIDGKSYTVGVEETDSSYSENSFTASAAEPEQPKKAAPAAKAAPKNLSGEKVVSPFPGLIKNILVADGSHVKKDEPIIVLEAMKMDNDITSPCEGTVSFAVEKGANVETNTLLATIG